MLSRDQAECLTGNVNGRDCRPGFLLPPPNRILDPGSVQVTAMPTHPQQVEYNFSTPLILGLLCGFWGLLGCQLPRCAEVLQVLPALVCLSCFCQRKRTPR